MTLRDTLVQLGYLMVASAAILLVWLLLRAEGRRLWRNRDSGES